MDFNSFWYRFTGHDWLYWTISTKNILSMHGCILKHVVFKILPCKNHYYTAVLYLNFANNIRCVFVYFLQFGETIGIA